MPLPVADLEQRRFAPTLPIDGADPFRFAQLVETAKDCFQRELFNFFHTQAARYPARKLEVPTIEKFSFSSASGETAIETVVRVILQRPDILERLPLIAITSATGANLPIGIGHQLVEAYSPPARLSAAGVPPYALVEGDKLVFRTYPAGPSGDPHLTTLLFRQNNFTGPLASLTNEDVLGLIGATALYISADERKFTDPVGGLRVYANGPSVRRTHPNSIELLPPPYSTANALAAFGFPVGVVDPSSAHPPRLRYALGSDLTVNLDIGAESENTRRELVDLVHYFFSLAMDDRHNVFYGRSIFDVDLDPPENFQVILQLKHAIAAEIEVPRTPGSGEKRDLIYAVRYSVPIKIFDYVDRELLAAPQWGDQAELLRGVTAEDAPPAGDHEEAGETNG